MSVETLLRGEAFKARYVPLDLVRAKDALQGVDASPAQSFYDKATKGPYINGELHSPDLYAFLGNRSNILVAGCGRNEGDRLLPVLNYAVNATKNGYADSSGGVLYVDGNSNDGSVEKAKDLGVATVSRREVLSNHVDRQGLAEILAMPESRLAEEFESRKTDDKEHPPLRKGAEVLSMRIELLKMALEGKSPEYVILVDTDLMSVPGGKITSILTPDQVYYPIELTGQAVRDLKAELGDRTNPWAVFTGSAGRNNEPIFTAFNMIGVRAAFENLNEKQKEIASAHSFFPNILVHPLTGELIVKTEQELGAMNATGQAVEVARIMSLAGQQHQVHGTTDLEALAEAQPLVGNVLRGTQQRADQSQPDEKEQWMIEIVLPAFIQAVSDYAINHQKFVHEFDLDDYAEINRTLAKIKTGGLAYLHNADQKKIFTKFPMERAIPPVDLLYREGIIKV
jgi:hypothetical protein